MDENLAKVCVLVPFIAVALLMLKGLVLVVRDTLRQEGRWGFNLRPLVCPICSTPAPKVRLPKNRRQAIWGGCTCECGTEYDKWGHVVEEDEPDTNSEKH